MSNEPSLMPAPDEPTPPELQDIERLLDDDAIEWRGRVPDAGTFSRRLRQALSPTNDLQDVMNAKEARMEPATSGTPPTANPSTSGTPSRPPRRVPFPLAAVAAVIIVALLAGIFATLGQNRAKVGGETGTGTETPATETAVATPTTSPFNFPLHAGTPAKQLQGTPVVAPSDPQVVYEYADNTIDVVAQRSTDGGQTWSKLQLPTFSGFVSAIELAVNPSDAKNVFLRLDLGYPPGQPSPCASGSGASRGALGGSGTTKLTTALPTSNSLICLLTYTSLDSGGNWSRMQLPVAGSLFQTGVTFTYDATILQSQGATLYGRVWQLDADTQTGDIRIVRTEDDGQHWSVADASLQSQTGHICAFSANATALFAATSTTTCWGGQDGTRAVWKSDDRGAHWTRVGELPLAVVGPSTFLTAASGAASASLLYALPGTFGITGIQASADGGQNWIAAPSAGLPQNARPLVTSATLLADGSLLAAFTTGGGAISVFAWYPGASAWTRATPEATITGPNLANLYVSTSQPLTVTLSALDDDSTNPTYTLLPFA